MKSPLPFALAAATCLLASCSSSVDTPTTQLKVSAPIGTNRAPGSNNSLSQAVFNEVNAYRARCGAKRLQRHAGLDRLAQKHCEYLSQNRGKFSLNGNYVSHAGFHGRALYARRAYNMENISENVAATSAPGSSPAKSLLRIWKNSPDHHENLKQEWTHSGVGVVVDPDGMTYSTQIFATISPFQLARHERFLQH